MQAEDNDATASAEVLKPEEVGKPDKMEEGRYRVE